MPRQPVYPDSYYSEDYFWEGVLGFIATAVGVAVLIALAVLILYTLDPALRAVEKGYNASGLHPNRRHSGLMGI